MEFLPIFLNIRSRNCIVVGGGEVAARKIALLENAGARITIVSPTLCAELRELVRESPQQHGLIWKEEGFRPDHLDDAILAIAATSDRAINQQVSEAARHHRIPVNVVDDPALCSFIMPSIVDRSPVLVAVSSGGASPVLTRLLRARLETMIPAAYGRLAVLAADFRQRVKLRLSQPEKRRRFWEKVLQGPIAEMVFAGKDLAAKAYLERWLDEEADDGYPQAGTSTDLQGEVYLVGAGPGDPELLTFRAMRLMQQADVR